MIESSKSAQLRAHFDLLDQTDANGQPKFQPSTLRWVQRVVSCRSYAPPLHELCHLMRMAETRPGGAYDLFWTPMTATSANVRAWFRRSAPAGRPGAPAVEADETCVRAAYTDTRFEISYSRAADLLGLAEFLVTALGFAELDDALTRLRTAGMAGQPVAEASNALARALYAYLGDHLPSVQDGRLTRHLVDWLSASGRGELDTDTVDDETILAFWEAKAQEEGLRSYTACVRLVLRVVALVDAAATQRAVDAARPIGADAEAGEVDPQAVESLYLVAGPDDDPLERLTAPPADAAKPLNARERERLAWPVAFGAVGPRLVRTLVRAETFGAWQARLAQRARTDPGTLPELLAAGPAGDYATALAEFRALASHIQRVRLAALAALLRAEHPGALDYLVRLAPARALTPLAGADAGGRVDPDGGADAADRGRLVQRLLAGLSAGRTGHDELDRLLADAAKALRGLARQGFKPPYADAALSAAEAPLDRLAEVLDRLLTAADRPGVDWAARYTDDRARFAETLSGLYAGAPA